MSIDKFAQSLVDKIKAKDSEIESLKERVASLERKAEAAKHFAERGVFLLESCFTPRGSDGK